MSKGKTYEKVTLGGQMKSASNLELTIRILSNIEKNMNKRTIKIAAITALTLLTASLCSCDNPRTIAWSYYYCAKDTLEAGDPYAAQDFLEGATSGLDSILDRKADSLRLVIEKAIEEKESNEKTSN